MADLLAKWLNEDIKLSKKISDFEEDFSSGYLLGELLFKFNQQDNFSQFSQKDNISTKVKNFEKLEPTLRNLNIKFDSQQVDKIMKKERGYALRMLYQLKMILEKVYPPTDIAILRKTGKVGDNQPALKIGSSKIAYNKMQSEFFKTRLQALNKPQKTMNMELHQKKFDDELLRQAEEAKKQLAAEKEENLRQKQEIRRAQINKLQRNAGFMEEWLQKGVEDWKQNMAYKKEREQSSLEFEYKQAQIFNEKTILKVDEASKEVNDGIAQFEKTLKEYGINPRVTFDQADRALTLHQSLGSSVDKSQIRTQKMTKSLLQRPTMGIGGTMTKNGGITLASVGLRSKAKKPLDEKTRKERERRRRRMIADQNNLQQTMEKNRREIEVLQRMKRLAKQEEELAYESWRTSQCKQIIIENRKLREAKYEKRHELDIQNEIFKEKQMLDSMLEQMKREIETLQQRDKFMRLKDKEAKKQRQTNEAIKMIDAIFEIAHEAYIHQQKQDSDNIDPRNWHEWEQLFVEGAPIHSDFVQEDLAVTEPVPDNKSINIDYIELVDYLQNKGQWPSTLVSENKPNVDQIMSGASDAPAAAQAKGAKAPAKGAPTDTLVVDESDMIVGDKPENNYFVGDAVENIINLNFDARGRQLRPKNPHYLNLKLCFVGYAFSGKKLQAQKIKEDYGLETFLLNDIVQEALKFYQENPESIIKNKQLDQSPIKESLNEDSKEDSKYLEESQRKKLPQGSIDDKILEESKAQGLRENPFFKKSIMAAANDDDDKKSEKSELEEELNPEDDFRRCGQLIQECLFEGQEIPDQLYIDLFISKLRMTFHYKDKETLTKNVMEDAKKELELTRSLANLEEELRLMRDPDSNYRKKKKRTEEVVEKEVNDALRELQNIKVLENNGWILLDFPTNFSQAMLLEKALSGYQLPADLEPTQREIESKNAQLLVKPTEKPIPPKTLIPSGIDSVIWFDCQRDECLRRALGRRNDTQTGTRYHIQDNPPSVEKSPLCEILEPVDDQQESTACLIDRWVAFDQAKSGIEKWISQFGDENSSQNLLTKINSSSQVDSVYQQIEFVINQIVTRKIGRQTLLRSTIQAALIQEEEIEQEKKRQLEEEIIRKQKIDNGEPVDEPAAVEGGLTGRSIVQSKSSGRDQSLLTTDGINVDIRQNIDKDFRLTIMKLWQRISCNFKEQMIQVLKKQRLQREDIQNTLHTMQITFIKFLTRLDNKQQVLDKFIKDFNDFSDQYPDMREDDQTKEELHQRIDILSDELWEIAEDRKEQAIDERKKIMESGWAEFSQEYLTQCATQMMQCEIDKFKGTIQLIHDYYHSIEEKVIPETPEQLTIDLSKDEAELPEIEKVTEGADAMDANSYSYPRLEDIFRRAIRSQFVPDILAQASTTDAGKKGAPTAKGGKDTKKGVQEVEETKPESTFVKEMKEAIKTEKSILRFRLTQIRNWALKRLRLQRQQALNVYGKLDDWIQVSSKAENDAIDEVCDVMKQAIEDQTKIQDELRIKFMDFFVDKKILNYIDPPPPKLAAMEEEKSSRFSIPQLKTLVDELTKIADHNGLILDRKVVELFLRKAQNSRSLVDQGGLPKDWNSLNRNNFEKIIRNIDFYNKGSIDYKILATSCILLQSHVPKDEDLDQIKKLLNHNEINNQIFISIDFWFDATESQKDRKQSHPFQREIKIKEILFNLFKDGESNLLDCQKFINSLKQIQEIIKLKQPTGLDAKIKQVQSSKTPKQQSLIKEIFE